MKSVPEDGTMSHELRREIVVPHPRDHVFAFFSRPENLGGRLGHDLMIARNLRRIFEYRQSRMREIFGVLVASTDGQFSARKDAAVLR